MNHQTLPYLTYLKSTFAALAKPAATDQGAATQIGVAAGLIDYMIVQHSVANSLKAESYRTLEALLPAIETTLATHVARQPAAGAAPDVEKLAPANMAIDALHELKTICATLDLAAFEHALQLVETLLHGLLAADTPEASALCKSVVQIESDYNRKVKAAVVAQSAQTETGATMARNAKPYAENDLLAFIQREFPQEKALAIKKSGFVSGGYSKFTISIELENSVALPEHIILRGDAGATFGGVSVIDEYRLIKTMYENGVSVPKPLALEETGKVFGSPFLLVEKKPGVVIGHMFNLPAQRNLAICTDIAAKLAAIHRVPLSAIGTQIDGANTLTSDKMLRWIDESFAAWSKLNVSSPVFSTAFSWLRSHARINDNVPRTLVHGDYGLNNLLIHNDQVSAVLDWEFAHVGNPAYDLGYFYPMATSLADWQDFLQAYSNAGMPIPDAAQLNYAILLAATRLGVMVAQTRDVFTSGTETGIAGASVVGGSFYEETILRISTALEQVL